MRRGKRLIYTHDYLRLKGTLGMGSIVLAKGHPERKGIVERTNGYLETSFMPGRTFADRDDFNTQLGDWLVSAAGAGPDACSQVRCSEGCGPCDPLDGALQVPGRVDPREFGLVGVGADPSTKAESAPQLGGDGVSLNGEPFTFTFAACAGGVGAVELSVDVG